MKENKYDDIDFFNEYKKMIRSVKGLEGAGEWYELEKMMQNFKDKDVLDLGCGFGSVSYTHLTLPTKYNSCRSRWSPYH